MKKNKIILLVLFIVLIDAPLIMAEYDDVENLLRNAPTQFYYPTKNAVVWKNEKTFDYSNFPYQKNYYKVIKIFNQNGIKDYSQIEITYHPAWYDLKLNKIQVITPTGRVIPVGKENMRERNINYNPKGEVYSSRRKRIITIPNLQAGSLLLYSYQKTAKKRLMPKQIEFKESLSGYESKFVLKVASDKKINYRIRPANQLEGPSISQQNDKKVYSWTGYKFSGQLLISTIDSWQQFSSWYNSLITDQAKLNQKLQKKVQELTANLASKEAKIKALYNYVATEIRYIDHRLGVNGYKPLAVNDIYQNKFAVCKDKVYFLITLLQEIGVEADLVALSTKSNPDYKIVVKNFNHLLVYLPQKRLYLDPSDGFIRYGNLALGAQGKRAVNLSHGQIVQTPILSKTSNQEEIKKNVTINKDGSANIELDIKVKGFYDFIAKAIFGKLNLIGQQEFITKMLNKYITNPQLSKVNIQGTNDLKDLAHLNLKFNSQNYIKDNGENFFIEGIEFPSDFMMGLVDIQKSFPKQLSRQIIINLPSEYQVSYLPTNTKISNPEGQLEIKYKQLGKDKLRIDLFYEFAELPGVEEVSWVYIEDLITAFEEAKKKRILLEKTTN